jgi:hypothetical protein
MPLPQYYHYRAGTKFAYSLWDYQKIKLLLDNYKTKNMTELGELIGIRQKLIKEKMLEMGLEVISKLNTRPTEKIGWTKEQLKQFVENYPKMTIGELSKLINKTRATVTKKARELGLPYKQKPNQRLDTV